MSNTSYKAEIKFKAGIMMEVLGEAEISGKYTYFIDNPFLSASIEELKNFFVNGEIDGHKIEGIEYYAKACPPYETIGLVTNKKSNGI